MKKCSATCSDCCDFCRMYNFNPDHMGTYLGDGYCTLHEKRAEPGHCCEDFICFEYKVKKGRRKLYNIYGNRLGEKDLK